MTTAPTCRPRQPDAPRPDSGARRAGQARGCHRSCRAVAGLALPAVLGGAELLPRLRLHARPTATSPSGAGRFDNYQQVWETAELGQYFLNSLIITVPAVVLTLFLASLVAFVLARFSYRFNLTLLGVFLAANLLPPQALLVPVFRLYREIPLPTS